MSILKHPKYNYFLMGLLFIASLSYTIPRDINIDKEGTIDLRNRIVGARLEMDGISPYTYYWKKSDGVRYYLLPFTKHQTANMITASPYFHHLLYPIANLQQRTISRIWLVIEYSLYLFSILFALYFSRTIKQRWAVTIIGALIPLTEAWKLHVFSGQLYLFIPFFCFLFFYFFIKRERLLFSFFAGLAAMSLVLTRPTTILIFLPLIPFIIANKKYHSVDGKGKDYITSLLYTFKSPKHLVAFLLPTLLYAGFFFSSKQEQGYWRDYSVSIKKHIQIHQGELDTIASRNFLEQPYTEWEGWNWKDIVDAKNKYGFPFSEYLNIPIWVHQLTGKKIPYKYLSIVNLILVFSLSIFFYEKRKKDFAFNWTAWVIFGFFLYMTTDIFSPILRFQYYTVQWVFPLLLVSAFYKKEIRWIFLLLVIGVILNITNTPIIKVRHTFGEIIIMISLLYLCLSHKARAIEL